MARPALPLLLAALGLLVSTAPLKAETLPLADSTPLAHINFDDKPAALPVTDSFQSALASVAGDLGKHCGATEAYGWRLQQSEQSRVNTIFGNAVEKLQAQGYEMTPQTPASASREITVFTAKKAQQELLVMWSAGDLGLVLLMCESQPKLATQESLEPAPVKIVPKAKKPAVKKTAAPKKAAEKTAPMPADLPAVVGESAVAKPESNSVKAKAAETLTPEVKAMLDSLPESPATAPKAVEPMMKPMADPTPAAAAIDLTVPPVPPETMPATPTQQPVSAQ